MLKYDRLQLLARKRLFDRFGQERKITDQRIVFTEGIILTVWDEINVVHIVQKPDILCRSAERVICGYRQHYGLVVTQMRLYRHCDRCIGDT